MPTSLAQHVHGQLPATCLSAGTMSITYVCYHPVHTQVAHAQSRRSRALCASFIRSQTAKFFTAMWTRRHRAACRTRPPRRDLSRTSTPCPWHPMHLPVLPLRHLGRAPRRGVPDVPPRLRLLLHHRSLHRKRRGKERRALKRHRGYMKADRKQRARTPVCWLRCRLGCGRAVCERDRDPNLHWKRQHAC